MNLTNVTYYNAGAGSGKTYTLTEQLAAILASGSVTPAEIILTTFTTKAANDFKARSKEKLYGKGQHEAANLLDTAAIGTIHSVAHSIISKFWYHLGLSPKLNILSEEDSNVYISESLGIVATSDELAALADFARQFNICKSGSKIDDSFWRPYLKSIIGFATNYQITDFTESRQKSKDFFQGFVKPGATLPALQDFVNAVNDCERLNDPTDEKKDCSKKIAKIKSNFNRLTIADYAAFNSVCNSNKEDFRSPAIDPVFDLTSEVWNTQQVYDQVEKVIDILFDMATRWQTQYAEFKKNRNLLDFNDLEKYLLQLLEDPSAAEEIGAQYRYLFVDEFQDCSPIQVKIFQKLSSLMQHSYWVGDMKQSIYGFRGADSKLVESVVNDIAASSAQGCNIQTLPYSYRSVPEIVNFCNEVFEKAFSNIPANQVYLNPTIGSDPNISPLVTWKLTGKKEPDRNKEIVNRVKWMINSQNVNPSDIAILARKNDKLEGLAQVLLEAGIPVNRGSEAVKDSTIAKLAFAVLRLADNNTDKLAKAEIAFLTDPDYCTDNIISETLANMDPATGEPNHDFLDSVELVKRILALRPNLKQQSLAGFVESVMLELDMYEVAKKCGNEGYVARVLDAIIATAKEYEESAARLDTVPSVQGFITYLENPKISIPGDSAGVQLTTMHGSKGLEWKHVILINLADSPAKDTDIMKKNCFGTYFRRKPGCNFSDPFGDVYIMFAPFIYGNGNSNTPASISGIIAPTKEFQTIKAEQIAEAARLLYVAMTRPSHQLIFTLKGNNPYHSLYDIGVGNVKAKGVENLIKKHNFKEQVVPSTTNTAAPSANPVEFTFDYPQPRKLEVRDQQPSTIKGVAKVIGSHDFGKRIEFKGVKGVDMSRVGDCVHHIYQLCEGGLPSEADVDKVIADYGLDANFGNKPEIVEAWERLVEYVGKEHGDVLEHRHERLFTHNKDGRVYTGSIDLTFSTPQGTVLVDYKTCPMGEKVLDPNNEHFAGHYGGQLACYRDALAAAGEKVCATYLYYPVSGLIVKMGEV